MEEKTSDDHQKPAPDPRVCKVCSEAAGKHSYYGGQVCLSCRAFFRRSVYSGQTNVIIHILCNPEPSCIKDKLNCPSIDEQSTN